MFNDIVNLLMPDMGDGRGRRALVESALYGCDMLHRIDWSGPPATFTHHLVRELLDYGTCESGKPAVVSVLETARDRKGSNKHPVYNDLIRRIIAAGTPQNNNLSQGVQPMDSSQLITFLVTTGLWIQDYLGTTAVLRRQDGEKEPIELTDKETMQAEAPAEFEAAGVDVDAATEILQLKHDNIVGWLKDKEKVDKYVRGGMIPPLTGDNQKEALDQKIQDSLADIPTVLKRVGMSIDQT